MIGLSTQNINQEILKEQFEREVQENFSSLLKQKREKLRSEIRRSDLINSLKEKRILYSKFDFDSDGLNELNEIEREKMEKSLVELSKYLRHNDKESITISIKSVKKLFCYEKDYFLARLKNSSLLNEMKFYLFEVKEQDQKILEEIFFFLANLTAIDQYGRIIDFILKNSIHLQVYQILKTNVFHEKTLENLLWLLGNITGESFEIKTQLLEHNITTDIKNLFTKQERSIQILEEAIWLVSNLTKGHPFPDYELVVPILPFLKGCLTIENEKVLEYALWSLSYLSDGEDFKSKQILKLNRTKRIIDLALYENKKLTLPAVRVISNILSSDDGDVEIMIQNGVIDALLNNIENENKIIRKEVCFGISNLFASNEDVIEIVLTNKIMISVFTHAFYDEIFVRNELCIGLANAILKGNQSQILRLLEKDVLTLFTKIFEFGNAQIILHILKALDVLLSLGNEISMSNKNPIIEKMEECDMFKFLESLEYHPDTAVYEGVVNLMEKHFNN